MLYLRVFIEFFKTGLFAVGGGLATLPFLYEMAERTGWFSAADIANMIAISESTPGPMGVNMATYVGHSVLGTFGGIISTIGLICPSVIVIILISKALEKFKESVLVQKIFYGLRPASMALIMAAGLGVAKISLIHLDLWEKTGKLINLFDVKSIIVAVAAFVAVSRFKVNPIWCIACSAVIGIVAMM